MLNKLGCQKLHLSLMLGITIMGGSLVYAETDPFTILPTSDVLWSPQTDGFKRFEIILPKTAIEEALRYNDSSTLFYLASVQDVGLSFQPRDEPSYGLSYDTHAIELNTQHYIQPNFLLTIGFIQNDTKLSPILGVDQITTFDSSTISKLSFGISESVNIGWSRTDLSLDETYETYWYISYDTKNAGEFSSSYGGTTWSCVGSTDCSYGAGIQNNNLFASLEFSRNFDQIYGFVRLTTERGEKPEILVGLETTFGPLGIGIKSDIDEKNLFDNNSLRNLRYQDLSRTWEQDLSLDALRTLNFTTRSDP